eukprot:MONOS_4057.1-p1 / transcript=MONOS_4057.1 / gene=MONOS_4057 / organism=Monocercomonoides_exilis_PA203 / gene_product=unspecified product / transcript_product=unspecified product / location=Mono_scaffold00103:47158-48666(-) / protein_length=503 / sequence_SO=supercontig / SO=protein_coding / is_pseudo=false
MENKGFESVNVALSSEDHPVLKEDLLKEKGINEEDLTFLASKGNVCVESIMTKLGPKEFVWGADWNKVTFDKEPFVLPGYEAFAMKQPSFRRSLPSVPLSRSLRPAMHLSTPTAQGIRRSTGFKSPRKIIETDSGANTAPSIGQSPTSPLQEKLYYPAIKCESLTNLLGVQPNFLPLPTEPGESPINELKVPKLPPFTFPLFPTFSLNTSELEKQTAQQTVDSKKMSMPRLANRFSQKTVSTTMKTGTGRSSAFSFPAATNPYSQFSALIKRAETLNKAHASSEEKKKEEKSENETNCGETKAEEKGRKEKKDEKESKGGFSSSSTTNEARLAELNGLCEKWKKVTVELLELLLPQAEEHYKQMKVLKAERERNEEEGFGFGFGFSFGLDDFDKKESSHGRIWKDNGKRRSFISCSEKIREEVGEKEEGEGSNYEEDENERFFEGEEGGLEETNAEKGEGKETGKEGTKEEDDAPFSMGMFLAQLNIEPSLVGYSEALDAFT